MKQDLRRYKVEPQNSHTITIYQKSLNQVIAEFRKKEIEFNLQESTKNPDLVHILIWEKDFEKAQEITRYATAGVKAPIPFWKTFLFIAVDMIVGNVLLHVLKVPVVFVVLICMVPLMLFAIKDYSTLASSLIQPMLFQKPQQLAETDAEYESRQIQGAHTGKQLSFFSMIIMIVFCIFLSIFLYAEIAVSLPK